jgi:hypothetical protein
VVEEKDNDMYGRREVFVVFIFIEDFSMTEVIYCLASSSSSSKGIQRSNQFELKL